MSPTRRDVLKLGGLALTTTLGPAAARGQSPKRGGTLTIRSMFSEGENTATVAVRDTGVGIGTENLVRIFDPFFSTKEKGTGLGLSVVNGIVTRHNGKVEVDSTPGKGTEVRVTLPIT